MLPVCVWGAGRERDELLPPPITGRAPAMFLRLCKHEHPSCF